MTFLESSISYSYVARRTIPRRYPTYSQLIEQSNFLLYSINRKKSLLRNVFCVYGILCPSKCHAYEAKYCTGINFYHTNCATYVVAKKPLLAKTMDRLGLLQVNIMSVTQTRHENYQNKNVL